MFSNPSGILGWADTRLLKSMSANNQLVIYKKGKKFIVGHRDIDCGWHEKEMIICDTLEEAIDRANYFIDNNIVEYGLKINIKWKRIINNAIGIK